MSFCLPKNDADAFKDAIRTGRLDVASLMNVDSKARRAEFTKIVGENLAEGLNAAYESKLLLKDQQRGLLTWVKQATNIKGQAKLDFVSKISKMDRVLSPAQEKDFYADLAAKNLGHGISYVEGKALVAGAKQLDTMRQNWDASTQNWKTDADRWAYGHARAAYQDMVGTMMREANKLSFKEWVMQPNGRVLLDLANATKGIVASMDNSFFGRQGIRTLYTNPDIWAKNFTKSFGDFKDTLAGRDPILAIKADIMSRPNAMNGKYDNMDLAVGLQFEEAFPSSLPERIPLLGRLYKASENAFAGGAMRLRADLADRAIRQAEGMGIRMDTNSADAKAIGTYVNSLTGRGDIGRMSGDVINAAFFSLRYFKSNWDSLTLHTGGLGYEKGSLGRKFIQQQSAKNMLKMAAAIGVQYAIASMLWPDSVELDPRSSNFGKIKIGNTRFDITGGMGSVASLASRVVPTMHDGEWGFWSKSASSGEWQKLGKESGRSAKDVVEEYFEGKASPALGTLLTAWEGSDFAGNELSYSDLALGLVTPLPLNTFVTTMADPDAAPILAVMILDGFGIGASTYGGPTPMKEPKEFWQPGYFSDKLPAGM